MEASQSVEADPSERAPRRRAVLGLLVDRIEDSYQNELMLRVAEATSRRDASLVVYSGQVLQAGTTHSPGSTYDLASSETVDALIVCSGTLENRVGTRALAEYLERFDVPQCSVGIALPGVPSVLVDNAAAMCDLVVHLVAAHGKRRIAFIRGPEGNDESTQRYRGYLKALLDSKLRPDSELVCGGDFLFESGTRAVKVLLDERAVDFDAVVAANDHMALGAMAELERRGWQVPQDVAVVGFDDASEGRFARTPLSTVRQPLRALAEQAVQLALSQLSRAAGGNKLMIPTEPVLRRSCGCLSERQRAAPPPGARVEKDPTALIDRRGRMVQTLLDLAPALGPSAWAEQLVDDLLAELRGKREAAFIARFEQLLERLQATNGDHLPQQLLSALHREIVGALSSLPTLLLKGESLLDEARILAARRVEAAEVRRRLDFEEAGRALRDLAQALDARTPEPGWKALAVALRRLGIGTCAIATVRPLRPAPETLKGQLLEPEFVLDGSVLRDEERAAFAAHQLIPATLRNVDRCWTYVVTPLVSDGAALGLATFELGPANGMTYTSLAALISAALTDRSRRSAAARDGSSALRLERLRDDLMALDIAHQHLRARLSAAAGEDAELSDALAQIELLLDACKHELGIEGRDDPDSVPATERP